MHVLCVTVRGTQNSIGRAHVPVWYQEHIILYEPVLTVCVDFPTLSPLSLLIMTTVTFISSCYAHVVYCTQIS